MFKKLNLLREKDFAHFRISFETGRQSLKNVRNGLILGIFMQAFVSGLCVYAAADPVMYPSLYKNIIIAILYLFSATVITFSIIFLVPNIYQKKQHIQYLLGGVTLYNIMGISLYIISLFLLEKMTGMTDSDFLMLFGVTISLLLLFLLTIMIRLINLIKKGNYRISSNKYSYEKKVKGDRRLLSRIPELTIGIAGLVIFINALLNYITSKDVDILFIILLSFIISYLSTYMFAHSLITYYCKRRFASFNFNEDGNLHPWGSGDIVRDKELA